MSFRQALLLLLPLLAFVKHLIVLVEFDPNPGLSVGAIIGIVITSCVVLALILGFLRMKGYLGGKGIEDKGEINHARNL